MVGDRLPGTILCQQLISNLSAPLAEALKLPEGYRAVGILTCDSDDLLYLAVDEATKAANVAVAYARSLYAGAANATTALAGEAICVLSGRTPAEVVSGLSAARRFLEGGAAFVSASEKDDVVYLAHCVSSAGTYLALEAGVEVGEALAYLIAPPAEALVGLDAAMKASDVELCKYFAPPTETNFSGGLLRGTQSACQAACDAFAEAVLAVAAPPKETGGM